MPIDIEYGVFSCSTAASRLMQRWLVLHKNSTINQQTFHISRISFAQPASKVFPDHNPQETTNEKQFLFQTGHYFRAGHRIVNIQVILIQYHQ
jgi:hypothetical protein